MIHLAGLVIDKLDFINREMTPTCKYRWIEKAVCLSENNTIAKLDDATILMIIIIVKYLFQK